MHKLTAKEDESVFYLSAGKFYDPHGKEIGRVAFIGDVTTKGSEFTGIALIQTQNGPLKLTHNGEYATLKLANGQLAFDGHIRVQISNPPNTTPTMTPYKLTVAHVDQPGTFGATRIIRDQIACEITCLPKTEVQEKRIPSREVVMLFEAKPGSKVKVSGLGDLTVDSLRSIASGTKYLYAASNNTGEILRFSMKSVNTPSYQLERRVAVAKFIPTGPLGAGRVEAGLVGWVVDHNAVISA